MKTPAERVYHYYRMTVAAEEDGKTLKAKYYAWRHRRALDKYAKVIERNGKKRK